MADITLTHTDNFDDSDEGVFEQGDGSPPGSQADEDSLPPLLKIQKYAQSENIHERQTVWRVLVDLFKNAQPGTMTTYLPLIMSVVVKLADEGEKAVRQELLEQVPHLALVANQCSTRIPALKGILLEYLLPMVLRNLGTEENWVRRTAQTALFALIERGYITKQDIELHVCPTVLELSHNTTNDCHIGAITLMSKLAPLLGREVTERVFLNRFTDLCTNQRFYVRKVCAAHLGDFCSVVGRDAYEKILLPSYIRLCSDEIWGVRKACADVAMSVSYACPPAVRRATLAPAFAKLLQDASRWVRISAFQTLGPFISTFADPAISSLFCNNVGELMLVNSDGREFRVNSTPQRNFQQDALNSPSMGETFMDMFFTSKERIEWTGENQDPPPPEDDSSNNANNDDVTIDIPIAEDGVETTEVTEMEKKREEVIYQKNFNIVSKAMYGEVIVDNPSPDDLDDVIVTDDLPKEEQEDIKEIVETVKNAVLSFRTPEPPRNCDIECDMSEGSCRNLAESRNLLELCRGNKGTKGGGGDGTEIIEKLDGDKEFKDGGKKDELDQFNSYNYWYISPELPVDLVAIERASSKVEEMASMPQMDLINDLFSNIGLDDSCTKENSQIQRLQESVLEDALKMDGGTLLIGPDCLHGVPQLLIDHFVSMTDPSMARNTDDEMAFHCAYSLPAVVFTLGSKNWHLLKDTVEALATDMRYKVRRTVASSLHELALILGPDIATNYLTPIFDGFIKDLDEVRMGVLKHLAHFLKLISPMKRAMYLPRLADFLQADNELNWRFRQELAEQLRMAVPLFRPSDGAKHLFYIASSLLTDKVAAVRETSFALVCDLLRHISADTEITHRLLIMLAERFAHSKMWKRRQNFVLLCAALLNTDAIPLDVFASDVMPHLLDLSWDPVANVRLVVARTISKHMVTHAYFADPANQHYEGLETVIRRLQADKDRDVRHSAIIDSYTSTAPVH